MDMKGSPPSVVVLKFLTLFAASSGRNFKTENRTRNMNLLVSFWNPKFADSKRDNVANFGFGTLALAWIDRINSSRSMA